MDALPRLEALGRNGFDDVPLIVGPGVLPFQRESLALFGRRRLTPFAREHVEAESLVWPAPVALTGHTTPSAVRFLRDTLGSATGAAEGNRKLYVSRAPPAGRCVANEDELLPLLRARGFEVVRPELMGFADQVRAFAGATPSSELTARGSRTSSSPRGSRSSSSSIPATRTSATATSPRPQVTTTGSSPAAPPPLTRSSSLGPTSSSPSTGQVSENPAGRA